MVTGYTNPVCKGARELGTACGLCERCASTRPAPSVPMATMSILVKYLFRVLPEGDLAEGAASVVFTLKGEPMFCEIIRGKSTSPYNHRIEWVGDEFPEYDAHHWIAIDPGTQFGFEVAP